MRTIALLNQKGGVGKTSTCHHLAGAFARLGLRTLLVDNDPQASLTQGFLGPDATRALDPGETVAALYRGDRPFPGALIRPTGFAGIDLVPGHREAAESNAPRPSRAAVEDQCCLGDFLPACCGYDAILVDCPPNLHLCSWAALAAADGLVVPLQPEDYGAQGLADVMESWESVRSSINPRLALVGFLLTRVESRKTVHRFYEERLRKLYGAEVFEARMPAAAAFVEAIAHRKPVEQYKPRSPAAVAMRAIALEFIARASIPRPSLEPEPAGVA